MPPKARKGQKEPQESPIPFGWKHPPPNRNELPKEALRHPGVVGEEVEEVIKGYLRAKVEEKDGGERQQTKEKVKASIQVKSEEEEGGEEQKMGEGKKICFRVGLKEHKG